MSSKNPLLELKEYILNNKNRINDEILISLIDNVNKVIEDIEVNNPSNKEEEEIDDEDILHWISTTYRHSSHKKRIIRTY